MKELRVVVTLSKLRTKKITLPIKCQNNEKNSEKLRESEQERYQKRTLFARCFSCVCFMRFYLWIFEVHCQTNSQNINFQGYRQKY